MPCCLSSARSFAAKRRRQPLCLPSTVLATGGGPHLTDLDPSAVIPDRVRTAFDTFTEGVMVLDTQGRVMWLTTVLQAVSKQLFSGLRDADLSCRYGGYEFCIFLPGVNTAQAQAIAERLRAEIEANANAGVRSASDLSVTSSFGLAERTPDLHDAAKLGPVGPGACQRSTQGAQFQVWNTGT